MTEMKNECKELSDSNGYNHCADCGGLLDFQHVNDGLFCGSFRVCKKCEKCGKLHYFQL